jgi:peptidoglycan hydrolase-like protein with peptidoglycan-binding domain
MKKSLIASLLIILLLFTSFSFAAGEESSLPDISALSADQLKELKEEINEQLIAMGEMYEDIKKGSSGENVLLLQKRLVELGYLETEPTGKWDAASIAAMKVYEKTTGQKKPNGLASIAEQEAIFSDNAPSKPAPTPTPIAYGKFNYTKVSRNPEDYEGDKVKISGYVCQVMGTRSDGYTLRLATKGHYDNIILVVVASENTPDSNILEDDKITVYATLDGEYTYTSTFGQEITLPLADADSVTISQ